ncbi:unnamed protein product [Mytilus coruscus]|uniref:Uncharacterized protein n=1 Tax=Mytilus coruscus TaxID=42192 RepID=A0A6J8AIX0_MYTCO|nr:unnamed protein product [Mytilus coruscus]
MLFENLHVESTRRSTTAGSTDTVNELSTTNYVSSETTFITSGKCIIFNVEMKNQFIEFHDESTSRSTTSLSEDTVKHKTGTEESSPGIIAGVAVLLTVVMLTAVIILVLVFRKIYLRKQLLSRSVGNGKRTSKINYYATENVQEGQYQDIDISNGDYCLAAAVSDDTCNIDGTKDGNATYVRAISGVYDILNEKDNRKIPTKNQNENASKFEESKMEVYNLTSNLTVNQQTMGKNTNAIDKLQTTDTVDFDPTYNHINNVVVREDVSNYDHFSIQK